MAPQAPSLRPHSPGQGGPHTGAGGDSRYNLIHGRQARGGTSVAAHHPPGEAEGLGPESWSGMKQGLLSGWPVVSLMRLADRRVRRW